jgi:hypothetical protein
VSDERADPKPSQPDRAMLEAFLEYHRATLEMKCAGVEPPERLAERAVPPSSLSLLGLVRHMAEVERAWFQRRLAAREVGWIYCDMETNPDGDFDDVDGAAPGADLATWHAECDRAREVAAGLDLDAPGTFHERIGEPLTLRWVYLHMLEEYARHNGHADLLRERLDGVTGE